MKLKGKVVLITGAAVRVGKAIAMELASGGAHILIHYHKSEGPARQLATSLKKYRVKTALLQADMSDVNQISRLAEEAELVLGRVDVLVNSASAYFKTLVPDVTAAQWDTLMNTNLRGPFFLAQRLGAAMKRRGSGKIINIADWAGMRPYSGYLPYCISKAGVITMTQGLAKAFAPEVQVLAIAPGPILLPPDETEASRKAIIQATPLKRIGHPSDIAKTIRFLIEGTDFMTGALIPVDGGRLNS